MTGRRDSVDRTRPVRTGGQSIVRRERAERAPSVSTGGRDGRLPSGVTPIEHALTPTDSFDALYAPAHALVGPTAFAVHFLELVRPLLFPDPTVHYVEYQRAYPNGLTFRVELHGNGKLGLPTVFDYDVLFAVFHLAAERGVSERGEMVGVTFRDLARAVGWSDDEYGGSRHRTLKTALNRWAALSIATNIDLGAAGGARLSALAAEARDGRARGHAVDALPRRVLPKLRWYDVLKYGVDAIGADDLDDTSDRPGSAAELLGVIRIEPVWLDLIASGYTAWIDREFHASLDERYAKRLYEVLLVRALRVPTWSAHEPWVVAVNDLLEEMGVPPTAANGGRMRRAVVDKLPDLAARGVLGAWAEEPGRGARHRLTLAPGERLLAARSCAGLRMHERPELARLVWALQHGPWGFSLTEARHAAETRPGVALRVLQHAAYLHERGWEPRKSWGGWLKDALRDEYRFEGDARYQTWLAVRLAGHRVPAWVDVRGLSGAAIVAYARGPGAPPESGNDLASPITGSTAAPLDAAGGRPDDAPTATLPVEEQFEDTLWGRVRRRLRDEHAAVGQYVSFLQPLVAVDPSADESSDETPDAAVLCLEAPDAFAAEWVERKWRETIEALAADVAGRPVIVRVVAPEQAERGVAGRSDAGLGAASA